jgi:Brp/Blh family beta-carotene 15,15'-monooxygenase
MLSLNWQRNLFLGGASTFLLASLVLPRPSNQVELLIMAILVFFLGIPHGALDVLYLRKVLKVRSSRDIAIHLLLYVMVSGLVVAVWLASPLIFLSTFLIASALHFSGDPDQDASLATRIAVGGSVIAFPSLLHRSEITFLYSLLTDMRTAVAVVTASVAISYVVAAVAVYALCLEIKNKRYNVVLELLTTVLVSLFTHPLLAFTVYFCLMHSARHIIRTAELTQLPMKALILESLAPMAFVLIGAIFAWKFGSSVSVDAKVIQIVFVALAALTAPHMLIVEPIRFRGWRPSSA